MRTALLRCRTFTRTEGGRWRRAGTSPVPECPDAFDVAGRQDRPCEPPSGSAASGRGAAGTEGVRPRRTPARVRLSPGDHPVRAVTAGDPGMRVGRGSVAGLAAVVPAVECTLERGGGLLAVGLARTGDVTDSAAGSRLSHGESTPSGTRRAERVTRLPHCLMGVGGAPRGAGSGAAGVACTGPGSRPPVARSSETFDFYKTKRGAGICLHNYSDFLLSETADRVTHP